MSWTVHVIENSVACLGECMQELEDLAGNSYSSIALDFSYYAEGEPSSELPLDLGAMEHIDPILDIGEVLAKHKVNGRLCFADLEGNSTPNLWGYEFTNGQMRKLTGKITYD